MKYVLMFFTFLSVCNASDLLKIPLTLDAEQSFTIPKGVTDIDETFEVNPAQDTDFQKYLEKIKGYEIDSIGIAVDSWSGPADTYLTGDIIVAKCDQWKNFFDNVKISTGTTFYKPYLLDINDALNTASLLSKAGVFNVNFKGFVSNNSGGSLKIKVKVYLKIKVL